MATTPTTPPTMRKCLACKEHFNPEKSDKIFCCDTCKKAYQAFLYATQRQKGNEN